MDINTIDIKTVDTKIKPPPGFERLFPVQISDIEQIIERKDYVVRIDDKPDDQDELGLDFHQIDREMLRNVIKLLDNEPDSNDYNENNNEIENDNENEIDESDDSTLDIIDLASLESDEESYSTLDSNDGSEFSDNGLEFSDDISEFTNINDESFEELNISEQSISKNTLFEERQNNIKNAKIKPNSDKIKWTEDINRRKIFVGNVPFNCTQEEFEECFLDVPGLHKADIVKGHRDDSRGIGFVTMNSIIDAENLKIRDDIKCKGRILRFYPYQNNVAKNALENINNYVYIDGIPDGKDRSWLMEIFSDYGPFHRFFVAVDNNTGERKSTGFLDLVDDYKLERMLSSKYYTVIVTNGKERVIPISDSRGKPKRIRNQEFEITDNSIMLNVIRYRQKTLLYNKTRKHTRKDQLLSAMIIEEHKGHARERSGKRFRR